uniref:SH3 domain-containing protein n=1 Tax=Candidatus Kentrum sp. TC TaxID=2126339 RepID=A0A450ZUF4_9GAMM|nr:MAG: hypothetical protein BECKTC1821F_GA0114240_101713 [Candidatus Kentron sp. TC]
MIMVTDLIEEGEDSSKFGDSPTADEPCMLSSPTRLKQWEIKFGGVSFGILLSVWCVNLLSQGVEDIAGTWVRESGLSFGYWISWLLWVLLTVWLVLVFTRLIILLRNRTIRFQILPTWGAFLAILLLMAFQFSGYQILALGLSSAVGDLTNTVHHSYAAIVRFSAWLPAAPLLAFHGSSATLSFEKTVPLPPIDTLVIINLLVIFATIGLFFMHKRFNIFGMLSLIIGVVVLMLCLNYGATSQGENEKLFIKHLVAYHSVQILVSFFILHCYGWLYRLAKHSIQISVGDINNCWYPPHVLVMVFLLFFGGVALGDMANRFSIEHQRREMLSEIQKDSTQNFSVANEYKVVAIKLNVRGGPSLQYPSMGTISEGERVLVRNIRKDTNNRTWAQIGPGRWVSLRYLRACPCP